MTALRGVLIIALLAVIALPSPAASYELSMTCDNLNYPCAEGQVAKPVRWPTRCASYYVNENGTYHVEDFDELLAATQRSFERWNDIEGAEFRMQYAGLTNEDRVEYNAQRGPDGNANIVVWRDDEWVYASKLAYAITSVSFLPSSGDIVGADIEMNSNLHRYTIGDAAIHVDLENTLTHEVGHFLGLDHSADATATMYYEAPRGETTKRILKADDIEGFFAIYPAIGTQPKCPTLPSYFERPGDKKGCCATTAPTSQPTPILAVLLCLGLYRRRQRDKVVKR